jgi:histidinol-phosphate aminotransferase
VLVGNGSDDVLNLLVRCLGGAAAATGFTFPSYSLYPVLIGIQDGRSETIPFDRSMRLPMAQIAASAARPVLPHFAERAALGVAFSPAEIEELLAADPGVLVLDVA